MLSSLLQPSNALFPISSIAEDIETLIKPVFLKALSPIFVTETGIDISSNVSIFSNIDSGIVVNVESSENVIVFNNESSNAPIPIFVRNQRAARGIWKLLDPAQPVSEMQILVRC